MAEDQKEEAPWWAAFPEPKAKCDDIAAAEVFKLLQDQESGTQRDFLLVDVRRTDWEGGTISTSINLPAHSLYPTRAAIYQLVKQAGVSRVIFYCGKRQPLLLLQCMLTRLLLLRQLQRPRATCGGLAARLF
jgi:arsenical-resistance protein 2